jgi:hypothetical protein
MKYHIFARASSENENPYGAGKFSMVNVLSEFISNFYCSVLVHTGKTLHQSVMKEYVLILFGN